MAARLGSGGGRVHAAYWWNQYCTVTTPRPTLALPNFTSVVFPLSMCKIPHFFLIFTTVNSKWANWIRTGETSSKYILLGSKYERGVGFNYK